MALKTYSLARDGALHLTPHFRVREFAWVHLDTRGTKARWTG